MRLGQRPDHLVVAVLADAELRELGHVVPAAEDGSVAETVAQDDLALCVGEELAGVWATRGV